MALGGCLLMQYGNVGIGTGAPSGRLDVRRGDAHGVAYFQQTSGSFNCDIAIEHVSASGGPFLISRRASGDAWFYQAAAYNLNFQY
jgi:hypothetical protein